MGEISTNIDFNVSAVTSRIEGKINQAQKWLDNEALNSTAPYIPRQTGSLEQSGISGTKIGSGLLVYNSPYARYQYYGKVMVGRAPKTVTSKNLKYYHGSHAKAGRLWFEVSKSANKKNWIKGVKQIIGGD